VDAAREADVRQHDAVVKAARRHRAIVVREEDVASRRRRVEREPRHYSTSTGNTLRPTPRLLPTGVAQRSAVDVLAESVC